MKLPRYPKYKDSGAKWLGAVPEHWEVTRMKWSITTCKNGVWGNEAQQDENDIPCVRVADFDRNTLTVKLNEPTIRNVPKKDRVGRGLRRNDLLLEKSGGGEQQQVGCVVLYDDDAPAVCSNFIARVRLAPKMNASYWRYVHAAAYSVRLNTRAINQTSGIQNLDQTRYFDEQAAFPPPEEQNSITQFLEYEAGKIDSLINEQKRLIELLKEKRQTVISRAVTKGLDSSVTLVDSGVKWLGQVPTHWDIDRLGTLFREIKEEGNDDLPILSVSIHNGVSDRQLDEDEMERKVNRSEDTSKYKKVAPADLVYNMMRAWQGGFGTVLVPGLVSPAYVVARPTKDFSTRFIELLLRTPQAIEEIRCHSYGVTDFRLRLYWDNFKIIRVALPPRPEQEKILSHIEKINDQFDKLIEAATISISTLQERRNALITAAVTGQIDVRNYRPQEAPAVCQ
jgi:type I restriction enzyme S subunit